MQLNYKSFGAGAPVIILHGLFGTLDNWQSIAKRLADNFLVFIIDQRNHGRSPHEDVFDYPTLAEDLHEFMEQQWMYHANIIGHSMGGKAAMQFALQYPDMVDKLVVVDIAPKPYWGGHEKVFAAIFAVDLQTVSERRDVEEILRKHLPNEEATVYFLLKNLSRNVATGQFEWKADITALYNNYPNILAAPTVPSNVTFNKPTLFVRGAESKYVQDEDWHAIQQHFTDASLTTIADAGHWVNADQPEKLIASVQAFLQTGT
ncbi:MAG: alpha/beta fold hydrolase [Saprospiraceae bacterium]|nr:alpha/beta fold hydrolase [Saprospiraceae bacterium]MBP7679409.1 alpha/beta fold hydrolase [Saprospiraceae bacterium]